MADRERVESRAEADERRREERDLMLDKRQEDFKVMEEVFDRLTTEGVYKLLRQGIIKDIDYKNVRSTCADEDEDSNAISALIKDKMSDLLD